MKLISLVVALFIVAGSTAAKDNKPPKGPMRVVVLADADGRQIGVPGGPVYAPEFSTNQADWIFLDNTDAIAVGVVSDDSFPELKGQVVGIVDVYFSGADCLGSAFVETIDVEGYMDPTTKESYRDVPSLGGDHTRGFYIADLSADPILGGEAASILRKLGQGCESGTFPMISRPAIRVGVSYAAPVKIVAR
jgi:hypothetical protein